MTVHSWHHPPWVRLQTPHRPAVQDLSLSLSLSPSYSFLLSAMCVRFAGVCWIHRGTSWTRRGRDFTPNFHARRIPEVCSTPSPIHLPPHSPALFPSARARIGIHTCSWPSSSCTRTHTHTHTHTHKHKHTYLIVRQNLFPDHSR
jgi:hypothetical protein